jgi:membrane associated rhomboid family serine protease
MLLIPLGLENRPILRVPWVTMTLVAANVCVFMVTNPIEHSRGREVTVLGTLVAQTLDEHPYLTVNDRLASMMGRPALDRLEAQRARSAALLPAATARHRQQQRFDLLANDFMAATGRLPSHSLGYIPAQPRFWALLTSMFVHAGWLHLLGNMFILYVSGSYIEDTYGRFLYLLAYLISGAVGALGHALAEPASTVPLVGASGAIAGLMGITLVRLARERIRFLFLPLVIPIVRIPLTLPALVVLPLWFVLQLASTRPGAQQGVAWLAHVSGFVGGCAVATVVALFRFEERWAGTTAVALAARRWQTIASARERGDLDAAHRTLTEMLRESPDDPRARREALGLALAGGDPTEITRAAMRLLELLSRSENDAQAAHLLDDALWEELGDISPRLSLAMASFLERRQDLGGALELLEQVVDAVPREPIAGRALVRMAEILIRQGRLDAAHECLARAQTHPSLTDAERTSVERAFARLRRQS